MESTFDENRSRSFLFRFTLLLSLQALVGYIVNSIDMFMVARLGETSIAAVGIANQFYNLLTYVFNGVFNSSVIFASQFWGKKDVRSLHKVIGFSLTAAVAVAVIFSFAAIALPRYIVGVFTSNPEVLEAGATYLRIKGLSYVAAAVGTCYIALMKSTGNAIFPLVLSAGTLVVNIFLNYAFIYGRLGFPEMGVYGAAVSASVLRYAECIVILIFIYAGKSPAAAGIKELFSFDREFAAKFSKVSLSVIINDIVWYLGIVTYNWIYAKMGVEAIAAVNICSSVEGMFTTLFVGMTSTCSIFTGNYIGAGLNEKAFRCSKSFLALTVIGSVLMGAVLVLSAKGILSFYLLSSAAYINTWYLLTVTGFILSVKVCNIILVVGILRCGGDTRFPMALDLVTMWGIGIPLALLGAFVLHLPVYWVVLLAAAEEIAKMAGGLKRFFSKRWIADIALS
ncbi:putative MATE family efflux protein [Ruminiclostridium sufflavum DSM 19573]|uniref:Putative MATE family efflux protein n=1 Tax=Ruminiclostridium sufflavum DSM 19573 TaxID=1121337 RepID=A0A318XYK7_9FIRM|nr:MATE family efflux transporter [Ruminiclostridium sufflavum]PYG87947.1 putative MATE family efflux protein [Ruminiclostridium sufflavum DSM 19573]